MTTTPLRWATLRPLASALAAATFACGGADAAARDGTAVAAISEFDAVAAHGYVEKQVAFGPRVPGTPAHKAMGDWLIAEMRRRADTVIVQEWTHTSSDGKRLPMRNVLARFRPTDPKRVLYLAHWDTRPRSDKETDPVLAARPVPGANDGGSGVAILFGVADALKKVPPTVGVDLLFVDGEDYGSFDTGTDVLIGAKYFAEHLPEPGYQPMLGVLWDMVGDADPVFEQEAYSVQAAPEVVQRVWTTAQRLGHGSVFSNREGLAITDDHVPLNAAGLRVIDVIDLDYPWHHMTGDTPDKVVTSTLGIVGAVAITVIRDF
ncbi:MAG: M28 family peptidase [Gemmatimonadetes bacterium]|nr:M28 family peptidase [Gemmatimonadota bacterium]